MFACDLDLDLDLVCRDDRCDEPELHLAHRIKGRYSHRRPRSALYKATPWKIACSDALRECVQNATSKTEPRTFSTILSIVENDYGSCCGRSVHRHLSFLRTSGEILRFDLEAKQLYVYLRAGSRLARDPDLIFDQVGL